MHIHYQRQNREYILNDQAMLSGLRNKVFNLGFLINLMSELMNSTDFKLIIKSFSINRPVRISRLRVSVVLAIISDSGAVIDLKQTLKKE